MGFEFRINIRQLAKKPKSPLDNPEEACIHVISVQSSHILRVTKNTKHKPMPLLALCRRVVVMTTNHPEKLDPAPRKKGLSEKV